MSAFSIVGLDEPRTITADSEVALAAFCLFEASLDSDERTHTLVAPDGREFGPCRDVLGVFRSIAGIDLNRFLKAHRIEIARALTTAKPEFRPMVLLGRALNLAE